MRAEEVIVGRALWAYHVQQMMRCETALQWDHHSVEVGVVEAAGAFRMGYAARSSAAQGGG